MFPTNPNVAVMFRRTDFDVDYVLDFSGFEIYGVPGFKTIDFLTSQHLNFPVPRFPQGRPGGGRTDVRTGG